MSNAVPFVNRKEELGKLRSSLQTDTGDFHVLVGPSGSGKSALLDQFQVQCEEDGVRTVRHDIGEPKSEAAFIYRLLEKWNQELPSSKWDSIKERVKSTNTEPLVQAAKFADPAVGTGARMINAALSGAVEDESLGNATDEVDFLINVLEAGPDERIVVIIDQFDERRLSKPVSQDLGRAFREIARKSPTNIVWCIGSDHEFDGYEDRITRLQVGPLDSGAIEQLLDKTGTDFGEAETDGGHAENTASFVTEITNFEGPNLTKEGLVDEIKTRTKGHPFMLALFLQTVRDEDISYAIRDLPMSQQRVRDYLEDRLLDRLEPQEEDLMRDVCVLEQFDAKLAAHLSGNTVAEARQILTNLKERSIIREVESITDTQTFRTHDLIREYLQGDIMGARERQSRYIAIAVFSSRLYDLSTQNTEEQISGSKIESLRENIKLHFEKVLDRKEAESVVSSVYSACEGLNYIQRTDVEDGLRYCYSIQDSVSIPSVVEEMRLQSDSQ
ncbi:AAA family ATPase [Haloarchaeobius sp. FL176]|uniref:AAA family ATPase n=1 Tax=Haloarchaeobius sp. FL176 TaxID=2967129 RepID=UPI0021492263